MICVVFLAIVGVLVFFEYGRRDAEAQLEDERIKRRAAEEAAARHREESNALQTTVDNQARRMRELVDEFSKLGPKPGDPAK